MGKRTEKASSRSKTLPPSPSHSFTSSSSDFEFSISLSPPKSSTTITISPADDLFYKGQLLPLHHSPRLSMVRNLLLSSSPDTTSASRHSTASSSNDSNSSSFNSDLILLPDYDSSRPSSVTEGEELKRVNNTTHLHPPQNQNKKNKYFSLSRFSSVFRQENKGSEGESETVSSERRRIISGTAKEVIKKYLKKVKPLCEKLTQKQNQKRRETEVFAKNRDLSWKRDRESVVCHSFSGNLRYPFKRSPVPSCPSSIRSSPNHSGLISRTGGVGGMSYVDMASVEEVQSAIEGAITHCKNSMIQSKTVVSN